MLENLISKWNFNNMKQSKSFIISILIISLIFISCGEELPVVEDISSNSYKLLDQDSSEVIYPENVKGKVTVIGYIFTNCPDICPLTTNNMRLVQNKLKEENITGVEFVSISFDPETDKPSVLKKYAELRNLDTSNWVFLTGKKEVTDQVIKDAGVFAIPSDTTETPSGDDIVFFVHTDRISLMDKEGRIRKNYLGSKIKIEEIVNDIKTLVN